MNQSELEAKINALRQRVILGEPISVSEYKEIITTYRDLRGLKLEGAAAATTKRAKAPKVEVDLGDLLKGIV